MKCKRAVSGVGGEWRLDPPLLGQGGREQGGGCTEALAGVKATSSAWLRCMGGDCIEDLAGKPSHRPRACQQRACHLA